MPTESKKKYLEAKIRSSSQPHLHLMLLDGALRWGRQAKETWVQNQEDDQVDYFLNRAMLIIEELVRSVSGKEEEISHQLEEQYAFIYREMAKFLIERDQKALDNSLSLLEYQRDTWRMVDENLDEAVPSQQRSPLPPLASESSSTDSSLSLEA